jgi:cobalt-zinc-cadmium efflux system protein
MACQHHHHEHHHAPHPPSSHNPLRRLSAVLVLTFVYLIAEAIGGWLTGSLALLADAGHMLADVGGIGLALFASWFSNQPASPQRTFGYYRLEILAAFVNGLVLVVMSLWILYEAYERFFTPPQVQEGWMLAIASGGFIVNLIAVRVLHGAHTHSLNMKGAYLHILGDLAGSVGAILAGLFMMFGGFYQADPIASGVIAVLVLYSAIYLVLDAVNILLESCPSHLNVASVKEAMLAVEGVLSVHDLHVWSITSGKDALSAHVVVTSETFGDKMLSKLQGCLKEKFGISHLTLQLEPPDFEEDEIHF